MRQKRILSFFMRLLSAAPYIFILSALPATDATARWISLDHDSTERKARIDVLESNESRIVLSVKIPGFYLEEDVAGGAIWDIINLEAQGDVTTKIGFPQLPVLEELLTVPAFSFANLTFYISESTEFRHILPYPAQPQLQEDDPICTEPVIDSAFYAGTQRYPGSQGKIVACGYFGNVKLMKIELVPFRYYPRENRLVVFNRFVVKADFPDNGKFAEGGLTRSQQAQLDKILLNPESLMDLTSEYRDHRATKYLIVTHPDFADTIQTLADWHHKRGLKTEVVSIDTEDPSEIKNIVETRYKNGQLEYLLLVGDADYMPVKEWDTIYSDLWYACLTNDPWSKQLDLFADVGFGRLSANSAEELAVQLGKLATYTKNPPRDSWMKKALFVAAKDDGDEREFKSFKEHIRHTILEEIDVVVDTTYGCWESGTNESVRAAINEGRVIVNYRGHGATNKWSHWGYNRDNWTLKDIQTLENGSRTPWVFNFCCHTGRIFAEDCLAETWVGDDQGGIASIGASAASWTRYNNKIDNSIFEAIYHYQIFTFSGIMDYARSKIIGGPYGNDNAKMYFCYGDPTLRIWTKTPQSFTVDYPGEIYTGSSDFSVTVEKEDGNAVQGALVCLYKKDDLYLHRLTNDSGEVTLTVDPETAGELNVTVTKHNFLPFEGVTSVVDP